MAKRKPTIREYVQSFDRNTTQYQIAQRLGIRYDRLSKLLRGFPPSKPEAEKLRAHGIAA